MALSPNAQQALITGIFSGAGTLGQMLQQNAQNKQQQQQFDQQFQRSTAGDLLAANPLGAEASFQTKRRLQQAMLASLIKGGFQPGSAAIAEHMPTDNIDLSGLVGPLGDEATADAIAARRGDLELLRNAIQRSGHPQALASGMGGGFNPASMLQTGMGALDLYKGFGGKIPQLFGNPAAANAATTAGNVVSAAPNTLQALTAGKPLATSFFDSVPVAKGGMDKLTGAIKGGGVGGILGGFGTAMAIRNGQVGNATMSGALTGLKYGGPLGAAIGGGIGLVGSLISKNQNKTKGDREKFVKSLGYSDLGEFNNYLSTLGPEGQALRTFGESVVGRHNNQQNAEWLQRAQALLSRPQQVRLY